MTARYLTTAEAVDYLAARMVDPPTRRTMETWSKLGAKDPRDHPRHHKSAGGRVWWSTAELDAWVARVPADWKGPMASAAARPAHPPAED